MTYSDFFTQYNGKTNVGNTSENKGQCVGLVAVWIDALGLSHVWGDACDLFVNADETFFDKILNTPDAIPQQGDIMVWSKKFNGTAGHTGIATGTASLDTFECFQQNDPTGSNCHIKSYTYDYVTGWLRPKQSPTEPVDPAILAQSDAFIAMCTRMNVAANKDLALAELDKLIAIEDAAPQKDKQLSDANSQVTFLQKQLADIQASHDSLQKEHDSLQAEVTTQAKTIQDQNGQISALDQNIKDLQSQLNKPVLTGWKLFIFKLISR
jgi:hypothetical protein